MTKLSVVINNLNEKNHLKEAILSVKNLADEVVVVDMESDDGSREEAERMGAKVYSHKRLSYVEPARNFGIEKATGQWILILDPDERINRKLESHIKQIIRESKADFYRLPGRISCLENGFYIHVSGLILTSVYLKKVMFLGTKLFMVCQQLVGPVWTWSQKKKMQLSIFIMIL